MNWLIYVALLLAPSVVVADESFLMEGNRASELLTAGEDAQALSFYQALLEHQLTPWQRSFVLYNIGSIHLQQGHWRQALEQFQQINLNESQSLQLVERVKVNSAIALLAYVRKVTEITNLDDLRYEDTLQTLLEDLESAKSDIATASHAACFLKGMQPENCEEPQEISAVRQAIEAEQENLNESLFNYQVEHSTPLQLLARLVAAAQSGDNTLLIRLKPIWGMLQGGQYDVTRHQYDEALRKIQHGDQDAARLDLTTLSSELRAVMLNWVGDKLLGEIAVDYALALSHEPLDGDSFLKIQADLATAGADKALVWNQKGLDALKAGSQEEANLYFLMAAHVIDEILRGKGSGDPEETLRHILDEQKFALSLAKRIYNLSLVGDKTELIALLQFAQKSVLATSKQFTDVVLAHQQTRYSKGECQKDPWVTVMPLFFYGEILAQKTLGSIPANASMIPSLIENQSLAYRYWEKALQAMKQTTERETARSEQPLDLHRLSEHDTLLLLQRMDEADRALKSGEKKIKPGERPW